MIPKGVICAHFLLSSKKKQIVSFNIKVTLLHLMSHTSGFGMDGCEQGLWDPKWNFEELNTETCAQWIYEQYFGQFFVWGEGIDMIMIELDFDVAPGNTQFYAETHWQLAHHIIEVMIIIKRRAHKTLMFCYAPHLIFFSVPAKTRIVSMIE